MNVELSKSQELSARKAQRWEATWGECFREDAIKPIIEAINRQAIDIVHDHGRPSAVYVGNKEFDLIRMFGKERYRFGGAIGMQDSFMGFDIFHVNTPEYLRVV